MLTPRLSASGRSVSVASSAIRDRSTGSWMNERWSARLSSSNASVRSIARVLTAWRRSRSSRSSRFGSLRATSRIVCVVASGVRSWWDALATNLCCSATCASSRTRRPSMVSARSFSSSRGPASARRSFRLRSEICRVVAVIARSGRRTRPAISQPRAIETTVMIVSTITDRRSPWWSASVEWRTSSVYLSSVAASCAAALCVGPFVTITLTPEARRKIR